MILKECSEIMLLRLVRDVKPSDGEISLTSECAVPGSRPQKDRQGGTEAGKSRNRLV